MFGLMKPRGCNGGRGDAAKHRRLHYCGTCKTMGRLYGQRSRMLLNNDAVFLAELLTEIGQDRGSVSGWSRSLHSYNCASLPQSDLEMPIALRYAAAATLVMSEMKLKDHSDDSGRTGLKLIGRIYSKGFHKAASDLKHWGASPEALWRWYGEQQVRESNLTAESCHLSAEESIHLVAEPTSRITGIVFGSGASAVGANDAVQAAFSRLGEAFGTLIYLIDAFEDVRKDAKRGEFNAFLSAFKSAPDGLSEEDKIRAVQYVQRAADAVTLAIGDIPIPEKTADLYVRRVTENVAGIIGTEQTSCCATGPESAKKRLPRWRTARTVAIKLTGKRREECGGILSRASIPLVFAGVLLAAFLFPRQAISTASSAECIGLLFNLMVWGAAFNAVLAILTTPVRMTSARGRQFGGVTALAMDGGIPNSSSPGKHQTTVVTTTRVRRGPGCCSGCNCSCYEWCQAYECACCTYQCCDCVGSGACCDCCSSCM